MMRDAAEIIEFNVRDPRLAGVTVTAVKITDDLKHARIYYTVPSDDAIVRKGVKTALDRASGFIKKELAARLVLKLMPEIAYEFDETIDHARRIDELLKGVTPSKPDEE